MTNTVDLAGMAMQTMRLSMLSSIVLVKLPLAITKKMNELNVLAAEMGREKRSKKVVMKTGGYAYFSD